MSNYETIIVYSVKNGEEAAKALSEKFKAMMEKNGTVDSVDEWVSVDLHISSTMKKTATMFFTITHVKQVSLQSSSVFSVLQRAFFVQW